MRKTLVVLSTILGIILVCVLLGFSIYLVTTRLGFGITTDCQARNNEIPEPPIYPESVLIEKTVISDIPAHGIYEYTFSTTASPESVIAFYQEQGSCWDAKSCQGDAHPFGKYVVNVEASQGNTSFRINLTWDKCPADIRERSVED